MNQSGFAVGDIIVEGASMSRFGELLRTIKGLLPKSAVIFAAGMTPVRAEKMISDVQA